MHPFDQYMVLSKCAFPGDCTGEKTAAQHILEARSTWYGMNVEADAIIGTVFDELESLKLLENTYFIFTSDHGENNLEHRQSWKNSLYEPSVRVPLLFSGPGIPQNIVVRNLTTHLDVFPTIMDLAGGTHPPGLVGESLYPLLGGKPELPRKGYVVSQFHSNFGNTGSFMLRDGEWKYIAFGTTPPYQNYKPLLFNVVADPWEVSDVSRKFPEVVSSLDRILRSEIDYPAVDLEVKKQDLNNFNLWQQSVADPWTEYWQQEYSGFDAADQQKAMQWLKGIQNN